HEGLHFKNSPIQKGFPALQEVPSLALKTARRLGLRTLKVVTDSNYCVQCATTGQ
ncbi:unnamed protein product, partial [Didymodactylos carnosus]